MGRIGLVGDDPQACGTHSLRRTKATLIGRRTTNLTAVRCLPGHTKRESAVRRFGIEVDDTVGIAERGEIGSDGVSDDPPV